VLDVADLHLALRGIHITSGALGLVAFWAAVCTKKGAAAHIGWGRVFVYCAFLVGVTAVLSAAWAEIDPFGFGTSLGLSEDDIRRLAPERAWLFRVLGLAGVSLLAYIQVGVYAVRTKAKPRSGGNWLLLLSVGVLGLAGAGAAALGISGIVGTGPAIQNVMPSFLGLVAVPLAYTMLRFVRRSRPAHMDWWYKHMECMLVSGIIFHTALAITVSNRLLQQGLLSGPAALVPWVLPTVIGVPVTFVWILRHKMRFGPGGREQAEPNAADVTMNVKAPLRDEGTV
jgi:hypothetical protein